MTSEDRAIIPGLMRVHMANVAAGPWKKAHKVNVLPRGSAGPRYCEDCGEAYDMTTGGFESKECKP